MGCEDCYFAAINLAMVTKLSDHVGRYLVEYAKYFRSYFSSGFHGDDIARDFSAHKVRELDRIARERLNAASLEVFVSERDAFRQEFFENFRDWILVACAKQQEVNSTCVRDMIE